MNNVELCTGRAIIYTSRFKISSDRASRRCRQGSHARAAHFDQCWNDPLRGAVPIGWALDGANRNDVKLLDPTLDAIADNGLLADIGTLTLDRSYDYPKIRRQLHARGLVDLDIQRRGTKPPPGTPHRLTLGLRWIVEATNTWWSNYGQLRRNTDRRIRHRHAALQLATAVLIVGRLIDYRNRWSPN